MEAKLEQDHSFAIFSFNLQIFYALKNYILMLDIPKLKHLGLMYSDVSRA